MVKRYDSVLIEPGMPGFSTAPHSRNAIYFQDVGISPVIRNNVVD